MASRHKFYHKLGNLRKRLEFKEKIVYNDIDDKEALCEPGWEELYATIARFAPKSVFEYDCEFGIHLVNLNRRYGYDCSGSVSDLQWEQEGHKWLKLRDHAVVKEKLHWCPIIDVLFVDNKLGQLETEQITKLVDSWKSHVLKGIVILGKNIDRGLLEDLGFNAEIEQVFALGQIEIFESSSVDYTGVYSWAQDVDMSHMFVSTLDYTMPEDNTTESLEYNPGKMWTGPVKNADGSVTFPPGHEADKLAKDISDAYHKILEDDEDE